MVDEPYVFEIAQSNMKLFSIGMTRKHLESLQKSIQTTLNRPIEKGMVGIITLKLDRDIIQQVPRPGETQKGKTAYDLIKGKKGG